MPEEPLLADLFGRMSPDHLERVAAWPGHAFGGPPAYSDRYGCHGRMISQHLASIVCCPSSEIPFVFEVGPAIQSR
jgi:truncated hemoglobin YjbI